MEINKFRIDPGKVETGVWKTLYEDETSGDKFEICVTKIPNRAYNQLLTRLQKPYQKLRRAGGEIPTKESEEITARAIAETVLLDWRGLTENGKAIAYDPKRGAQALLDENFVIPPDMIPFQDLVLMHARNIEDFLASDDIQADVKNLKAGVSGRRLTPAS